MTDIWRLWCPCTNEEFTESLGYNVEASATVFVKNKQNSSVVTGETKMRLSASPGAHAVRVANGTQIFERDWPASIDAINAIKRTWKAHPLTISHKCELARVGKEFIEIITTPVVVNEKALAIPSPRKGSLPL